MSTDEFLMIVCFVYGIVLGFYLGNETCRIRSERRIARIFRETRL